MEKEKERECNNRKATAKENNEKIKRLEEKLNKREEECQKKTREAEYERDRNGRLRRQAFLERRFGTWEKREDDRLWRERKARIEKERKEMMEMEIREKVRIEETERDRIRNELLKQRQSLT